MLHIGDLEEDQRVAAERLDDVGLDIEDRSAHRLGMKVLGTDTHQRSPGPAACTVRA